MRKVIYFITLEDALFFHEQEIELVDGIHGVRDMNGLQAALDAPQAAFDGTYLFDLFEMAATYVDSLCTHHPFVDGNKRTGVACALTFLLLNGYKIHEEYGEELADQTLSLVTHKIDKHAFTEYLRSRVKRNKS